MRPTGADCEATGCWAKYLGLHPDFSVESQTVFRRLALGVTSSELNFGRSKCKGTIVVCYWEAFLFVCYLFLRMAFGCPNLKDSSLQVHQSTYLEHGS